MNGHMKGQVTNITDPLDDPGLSPKELLRLYDRLDEAITPLAQLISINSNLIEDTIALALVMGIHAGEKRRARAEMYDKMEQELMRGMTWSGFR